MWILMFHLVVSPIETTLMSSFYESSEGCVMAGEQKRALSENSYYQCKENIDSTDKDEVENSPRA